MAARPVHFLRIESLLMCFSTCLASKHGITKSYIFFRPRFQASNLVRVLDWMVTRCTCLESFAGCCPGCLGRPNSPNCELKSKWYVCEDFHLVWSTIKSSEHLHWSFDLILISLTLNHAPPPRLSCFTPRAHTSNGICGQNRNAMSSVHDKLSQSKKDNFEMAAHQVLTGWSTQSDNVAVFETGSSLYIAFLKFWYFVLMLSEYRKCIHQFSQQSGPSENPSNRRHLRGPTCSTWAAKPTRTSPWPWVVSISGLGSQRNSNSCKYVSPNTTNAKYEWMLRSRQLQEGHRCAGLWKVDLCSNDQLQAAAYAAESWAVS